MKKCYAVEPLIKNTPIEEYDVKGKKVFVKREDLCIDEAKFSKARGVYNHLSKIGKTHIGVLDSYHSKAGWAVSYLGGLLNKKVHLFYPEYKNEPGMRESQLNAKRLGAEIIPLRAGYMQAVQYNIAKKILRDRFGEDSYMMPNALKLQESVDSTSEELNNVPIELINDSIWIISISTGTIAAGVIKRLVELNSNNLVILHMGYSRKKESVIKYLMKYIPYFGNVSLEFIDEGYKYKDSVDIDCDFPCNPYYDLKAWNWLTKNIDSFIDFNILFWNIGE